MTWWLGAGFEPTAANDQVGRNLYPTTTDLELEQEEILEISQIGLQPIFPPRVSCMVGPAGVEPASLSCRDSAKATSATSRWSMWRESNPRFHGVNVVLIPSATHRCPWCLVFNEL